MTGVTVASVRVPAVGLRHQARTAFVVWQREMIRFAKDRARMVSSLAQPVLFLFVLGVGLSSIVSAGNGSVDFKTFLFSGVLATSVLFTASFCGISMVWDRLAGTGRVADRPGDRRQRRTAGCSSDPVRPHRVTGVAWT